MQITKKWDTVTVEQTLSAFCPYCKDMVQKAKNYGVFKSGEKIECDNCDKEFILGEKEPCQKSIG